MGLGPALANLDPVIATGRIISEQGRSLTGIETGHIQVSVIVQVVKLCTATPLPDSHAVAALRGHVQEFSIAVVHEQQVRGAGRGGVLFGITDQFPC